MPDICNKYHEQQLIDYLSSFNWDTTNNIEEHKCPYCAFEAGYQAGKEESPNAFGLKLDKIKTKLRGIKNKPKSTPEGIKPYDVFVLGEDNGRVGERYYYQPGN